MPDNEGAQTFRYQRRIICAPVVNDDHLVDMSDGSNDDLGYGLLLVVRGYGCNYQPSDHGASYERHAVTGD
jgi:hypothetical protein